MLLFDADDGLHFIHVTVCELDIARGICCCLPVSNIVYNQQPLKSVTALEES
jgi:hypothetical protein